MSEAESIEYYWRPGCGFCMALERKLEPLALPLDKRNIWDDPDAAARVRSIANGNETVPTLVIGDAELVNPSAGEVLRTMAEQTPHLLPDDVEIPEPGPTARLVNRLFGS